MKVITSIRPSLIWQVDDLGVVGSDRPAQLLECLLQRRGWPMIRHSSQLRCADALF
jgi:hypothetical protein